MNDSRRDKRATLIDTLLASDEYARHMREVFDTVLMNRALPKFEDRRSSEKWLDRFSWMDAVGERSWPIFGAAYFIVAVKRVRGVKLIGPAWKKAKRMAAAPVPLANRSRRGTRELTPIE